MKVKNILVNSKGDTIGATIIDDKGNESKVRTFDILKAKRENNIKFENAIVDAKGFVRAKSGNLPKEVLMLNKPVSKQKRLIRDNNEYILMLKNIQVCHINRGNFAEPERVYFFAQNLRGVHGWNGLLPNCAFCMFDELYCHISRVKKIFSQNLQLNETFYGK